MKQLADVKKISSVLGRSIGYIYSFHLRFEIYQHFFIVLLKLWCLLKQSCVKYQCWSGHELVIKRHFWFRSVIYCSFLTKQSQESQMMLARNERVSSLFILHSWKACTPVKGCSNGKYNLFKTDRVVKYFLVFTLNQCWLIHYYVEKTHSQICWE